MILNEYGMVAYNEWIKLTERFSNFELDVFQIMPNHIHVILVLNDVGASLADAQTDLQANRATARGPYDGNEIKDRWRYHRRL